MTMAEKVAKIQCIQCIHFEKSFGSRHSMGQCHGKSHDGHRGQWSLVLHPCKGFSPRGEGSMASPGAGGAPESCGPTAEAEADVQEMGKGAPYYVAALRSGECAGCGGVKRTGDAFCRGCYGKLPGKVQRGLYKRMFSGFEEAYEEGLRLLNEPRRKAQ